VDLYARSNPIPGARAKVPLLHLVKPAEEIGDDKKNHEVILCESLIVAEYVAEYYSGSGGNLFPPRPEDRAIMRLFTELCGSSFSYFPLLRAKGDTKQFESALSTFKDGLVGVNAFLESQSFPGGPFLLGSQFSLAECSVAPFVQRCSVVLPAFTVDGGSNGDDENKSTPGKIDLIELCDSMGLDRLKEWINAVILRPSVIATGVPNDQMIKNTAQFLDRFNSMSKV